MLVEVSDMEPEVSLEPEHAAGTLAAGIVDTPVDVAVAAVVVFAVVVVVPVRAVVDVESALVGKTPVDILLKILLAVKMA